MTGVRIGGNISSLRAQRHLAVSSDRLSSSFQRLSSGQRINNPGDDAAGLSIAEGLKRDTKVFAQAIRNVNDGLSATNITQGALEQLTEISVRQKELAEQAASGTYSTAQRKAMNTEANTLVDEFNRIVESTSFNGIRLLDDSSLQVRVQAGYGVNGGISFATAAELSRTVGSGGFGTMSAVATVGLYPYAVSLGDLDADGALDMATVDINGSLSINLGKGDGTFDATVSYATGSVPLALVIGDVNADGKLDIVTADPGDNKLSVFIGKGDGSFCDRVSYSVAAGPYGLALGDVNGDGKPDLVTGTSNQVSVLQGNGNGSFFVSGSYSTGTGPRAVALGDLNGDGRLDLVTADQTSNTASVSLGNGDGSFRTRTLYATGVQPLSIALADLNTDGILDMVTGDWSDGVSVFIGKGDGTFGSRSSYATGLMPNCLVLQDMNGDGVTDMLTGDSGDGKVSVFLANGDGSFAQRVSFSAGEFPVGAAVGDLNGDDAPDIVAVERNYDFNYALLAVTHEVTTSQHVDLTTRESALAALGVFESARERVSICSGKLGSAQSRLEVALSNISASRENIMAAAGRILDIDVAEESSSLLRDELLKQAGVAVLAQANQQPSLVLKLLAE